MRNSAAIRRKLLAWYAANRRDLPWRRTRDPYRVWVSEIMLQQTRVAAALPYYERFLTQFPDLAALAAAPEQELLACWSGLGYYSRARNLRKAAREMFAAGGFPRDYAAIRALPGVGPYTAAAIASIVFQLPYAVLDGNVLRVLSRLTNDHADIASAATKARLQGVASDLLDRTEPGDFNQAMMELGATVCLPKRPQCLLCPLSAHCAARRAGTANELPVKLPPKKSVEVLETLLIVEKRGRILLRRRGEGESRLKGFWELPRVQELPFAVPGAPLGSFRHSITHHRYRVTVCPARSRRVPKPFQWIALADLYKIPVTTLTNKALRLRGLRI